MEKKIRQSYISGLPVNSGFLHSGLFGLAIALLWLIVPASSVAHSGFVDKNGCHVNNAKHVFECHSGLLKGQTFKSKEEALKALEKKKKASGTPGKPVAAPAPSAPASATKSQPPQQIPANRK